MKKTILTIVLAIFTITMFAQNEDPETRVPNGYQGFLEESNCWHFDENMSSTIQLSTTHGFYFNNHIYAGIGFGMEFNSDHFLMPFYTNIRYVFLNKKAVSPFISMRLGSFISENMGAYGDLAIGARFASKRDFAVSVLVTGTYYDKITTNYTEQWMDANGGWHYENVERKISPSGIALRVGIEW